MRKILGLGVIAPIFFMACGGPSTPEYDPTKITSVDPEVANQAKELFQVLPASAENPDNPTSPEKVALGHVLYYDTRLSKTGNNSCNSCHDLNKFGVDNLATSEGDNKGFGTRNSPTVLNAAFHSMQFWDGRAKDVEEQAGMPILNPVEMAIPNEAFLVKRLKEVEMYQEMFAKAFPGEKDPLTYKNIAKAIAAFERTLITPAPFDKFLAGNNAALNAEQQKGLKLFMSTGCIQCHSGSNLGGTMLQKFGVYGDYRSFTKSTIPDEGRKEVTKQDADKDMFKVPGLRNVAKTQPYFHDGSIADLGEAVRIMAKAELNKDLADDEVKAIVAFLESLTGEVPAEAKVKPAVLN